MNITKLPHAAVLLDDDATTLLVDPGALVPVDAADYARADAILFTHNHFDHFAPQLIPADFAGPIFAPADALAELAAFPAARALADGETVAVGSLAVRATVSTHLSVDRALADVANVGYLVNDTVFVTGDAFLPSSAPVILTGFNGPWQSMPMLLDYLRATTGTVYGIHDALLSAEGRAIVEYFVGAEAAATGRELRLLEPGERVAA